MGSLVEINVGDKPDADLNPENDPISPSANYREGTPEKNCSSCTYFDEGVCAVWNASVQATGVCDSYELYDEQDPANEDLGNGVGMSELNTLYCTDNGSTDESDGLIWKTVLRTGTWRYRPGAGQQPVAMPLHVVQGSSTNPQSIIGMADVVSAFEDGAIQHVTIPTSHADKVDENTGFVRNLKIEEDPDREGEYVLRAGMEFTDPKVKEKILNGSIANTSAGIRYDYIRKDNGKKYPLAMEHVALTNSPWINGMRPFGLSEEEAADTEVKNFEFDNGTASVDDKNVTVNVTVNVAPNEPAAETQFSEAKPQETKKEVPNMLPKELEGLDLAAEDAAEKIAAILQAKEDALEASKQEAETLRATTAELSEKERERTVEDRIEELKGLGLAEQSGFLKVVRQVLIADTGTHSLELSEDGKTETVTPSEVVNKLIDALPKKDGKIHFGDQAESLGAEKPPADTEEENKPNDERYADAHEFLYGAKPSDK